MAPPWIRCQWPDIRLKALQAYAARKVWDRLVEHRLPHNLNVSLADVEAEALMMNLRGVVAVSSGSACSSASLEPSYVLRALGVPDELAYASVRFGLGRGTTEAEIDVVVDAVEDQAKALRELSPRFG